MSSASAFQSTVTAELTALRAENAELKSMISDIHAKMTVPSGKSKKSKKEKPEASGEPKEKREGTSWSKFSAGRVGGLIRAAEEGMAKDQKTGVAVILQFASTLKLKKGYDEWQDDEIMAEWESFEPPAISKKEIERQSKGSVGSAAAAEPVADEVGAGEKKKRKPQSEETKAAAAIKRAATKAAKATMAGGGATASSEAEEEQAADAPPPAAPSKPASVAKKASIVKKKVDLFLDPWTHDGEELLKNERGDVVSVDGDWVGKWDGKTIDKSAPEPADFEQLTSRD